MPNLRKQGNMTVLRSALTKMYYMKKIYFIFLFISIYAFAQNPIYWKAIYPTAPAGFPYPGNSYVGGNDLVLYTFSDWVPPYGTPSALAFSISTNGGETWQTKGSFPYSIFSSSSFGFVDFHPISEDIYFMLVGINSGGPSRLYKTTNGGSNWTQVASFPTNPTMLHFFNNNEGIVICEGPNDSKFKIYKSADSGNNWHALQSALLPDKLAYEFTLGPFNGSASFNDSFWFCTNNGKIFKTNDKGASWSAVQSPYDSGGYVFGQFETLGAVAIKSDNIAFTMGLQNSDLHKTTDGGLTWVSMGPVSPPTNDHNLLRIPGTDYMIFTAGGGTKYSNDYGVTWHVIDNWAKFGPRSTGANNTFSGASSSFGYFFKLMGVPHPSVPPSTPPPVTTIPPQVPDDNNTTIGIYPIPTEDHLFVFTPEIVNYFQILDAAGRLILFGDSITANKIDVSWFPKGNYIISVNFGGKNITRKFIKN